MKVTRIYVIILLLLATTVSVLSCKKNLSFEDNNSNQPPVASAGPDTSILLPVNTVLLDGSRSTDPNGNLTTFLWTKIAGPSSFFLENADAARTTVTNLEVGTYQFELKLTNGDGMTATDTIQVEVIGVTAMNCGSNRPEVNVQLIQIGTLSKERAEIAIAAAGDKIVFAGGYNRYEPTTSRVDIYHLSTNRWSTAELSVPRTDATAIAHENKLFFAGGGAYGPPYGAPYQYSPNATVDIYDVATNTWSATSMSAARYEFAVAAVGNKVFFAGGRGHNWHQKSKRVDIYDLTTKSWSTAELSEARSAISAVTAGSKIYFAGGYSGNDRLSKKIDIYDNTTGSWSTAELSEAKGYMGGISVGNKIYWMGGFTYRGTTCKVEILDVSKGTFSFDYLLYPASHLKTHLINNKIINLSWVDRSDIYDVTTNTWRVGTMSPDALNGSHASFSNTIYKAGGVVERDDILFFSDKVFKLGF